MFVNKYTIPSSRLSGTTGYTINISTNQNGGFVGQQEIVDTKFVDVEVAKAVNIIYDYEKVKILPKNNSTPTINVTYKVSFLRNSYVPTPTTPVPGFGTNLTWSDLGFIPNDFQFRKKSFSKSFLRLDFYDSDIATNQNHVSFITLFPKFERFTATNLITTKDTDVVQFQLGNTVVNRNENGEGFSLYYFKDEIIPTVPKHLYMRATFNNAKDGKSTGLMASNVYNHPVDDLMKTTMNSIIIPIPKNNLYTRYILTRDIDGYFYQIDTTYSNNITKGSNTYDVNLYQISSS